MYSSGFNVNGPLFPAAHLGPVSKEVDFDPALWSLDSGLWSGCLELEFICCAVCKITFRTRDSLKLVVLYLRRGGLVKPLFTPTVHCNCT